MKKFKIYNTSYELQPVSSSAPDAYAFRNELHDEVPNGKKVGYVVMQDGSVIECYTKLNPAVLVIPLCVCVLSLFLIVGYYVYFQDKDAQIVGVPVKIGTDKNVVSYNGFMSLREDSITVNFQNGDYPAKITVVADGVECKEYELEPGEYVASIPATFTTEEGNVPAKIKITTETSTIEQDVIIEIPSNIDNVETFDTVEDSEESNSLSDDYWKGECIYGTDIKSTN